MTEVRNCSGSSTNWFTCQEPETTSQYRPAWPVTGSMAVREAVKTETRSATAVSAPEGRPNTTR